jgi:hypothetical protein
MDVDINQYALLRKLTNNERKLYRNDLIAEKNQPSCIQKEKLRHTVFI